VFNIGPTELILIMVVALLVVGPKRLPEVGKTIGRSLREFRKAQEDLKGSFNFDLEDPKPEPTATRAPAKSQPPVPSDDAEEEAAEPEHDEAE